jgi:hypothetical protein
MIVTARDRCQLRDYSHIGRSLWRLQSRANLIGSYIIGWNTGVGWGLIDGGGGNSRKVEVASRNINKPARLSTGDVFDTVPVAPSLLWIAPPVKLKRISTRVVAGKRYSIALG